MTKEIIKERIREILKSYDIRALNQSATVEYLANIVIEGAKELSNGEDVKPEPVEEVKQKPDNEPTNILHLEGGYKVCLKGCFSAITIDKQHYS